MDVNDKSNPQAEPGPNTTSVQNNYKYRDIKIHSSDEWMADATKKYRKMFDRYETTYMRAEFSFYNKLFDEADWEANFRLKCFFLNGSNKTELCSLEEKRKVLKDENVVYIRQAWGNPQPGAYWMKGDYQWEGYINDVKVGESKFHIEDVGPPRENENLYFDIESIKMFEGNGQESQNPNKKYLTKFKQSDTRYVWCEFQFKTKTDKDYYVEIFFNFYNDAGQLKGSHAYVHFVPANTFGQVQTIYPGWGGDTPGRWDNDLYTMEVVFLDQLLATVPFQVGSEFEEGQVNVVAGTDHLFSQVKVNSHPAELNPEALISEGLAELDSLTGLTQIKQEVNEIVQLVRFYQETGKDILSRFSLHTVFTGNPGTGKTTVARILSKIYKGLGILEKGHLVEVDREGLVAGFIGQTAIKTAEKVNEAMGGVLFIDEAYSLASEGMSYNDFGKEAIQVILKRMEDNRGKFGVIVAGYTDNMQDFISSNPGLRSRFDKFFEFPDYTPHEMFTIANAMFSKEGVRLNDDARNHLYNYFTFIHERRDKHFGNARTVRQVVGEAIKNQHLRLAAMRKEDRVGEVMEVVLLGDVLEFEMKETTPLRAPIGFRSGQQG